MLCVPRSRASWTVTVTLIPSALVSKNAYDRFNLFSNTVVYVIIKQDVITVQGGKIPKIGNYVDRILDFLDHPSTPCRQRK